jgi:hypothetical protein
MRIRESGSRSHRSKTSNDLQIEPSPRLIVPHAMDSTGILSPVPENESPVYSKSQLQNSKDTSPASKNKKDQKKRKKDDEATGGHIGKGAKANNAVMLRIDKIEKYLNDRFDWMGVQKVERDLAKAERERSRSNKKENLPKLMDKK